MIARRAGWWAAGRAGSPLVVALSGGKDSTAMALRLAEVEPAAYTYVCTPTGNELPEMFAHWRRLSELLGKPILPVTRLTLASEIVEQGALPNWRQRWCTRRIKIEPFADYLATVAPATAFVGLRADEPERQGGVYDAVGGITMRFPLREWGWKIADVVRYNESRGVCVPKRTDCAVCFFQRIGEWYDLWREHPDEYAKGEAWEAETAHTFRSPGRDTWPPGLAELRQQFERGRVPRDRQNLELFKEAQCRVCSL